MRAIGSMGESFLNLMCSSVGLTANSSKIDRTGWDFFIEFPFKENPEIPKDMILAPIECRVQVKSTDSKKRKLAIKISTLNRLIKAQMPTFFCFIEFAGKNEAQNVFLVHVGKEIIEKTLKRIRELDVKGESNILHKRTIVIHYDKKDRLLNTNGECLKKNIEKYVPNGMEKYIENKNELLKTLGFEKGTAEFTVTLSGEDREKGMIELMDLTLGIQKEVRVSKFIGRHTRFGILSKDPFVNAGSGILSTQRIESSKKATITFKEYDFSPGISFTTNLYTYNFNNFMPKKLLKFRLEGKFFDIIFEPYKGKAKYTFSLSDQTSITIKELKDCLKVLTILKNSSSETILEIKADGLPPLKAKISVNDEIPDFDKPYKIAEKAIWICKKLDLQEDKIIANTNTLFKYSTSISSFYTVLSFPPDKLRAEFTVEDNEFRNDKKTAFIIFLNTVIGNHVIGCYFAILGYLKILEKDRYQLTPNESIIGPILIAKDNESIDKKTIDNAFDKFSNQFEINDIEVVRNIS